MRYMHECYSVLIPTPSTMMLRLLNEVASPNLSLLPRFTKNHLTVYPTTGSPFRRIDESHLECIHEGRGARFPLCRCR